jgi:hypothetical protein
MNRSISLILTLTLCVLLARCIQAESVADPNNNEEKVVTIELTKLDVNDTTIELSYKITNNTYHDVWICDSIDTRMTFNFEVFLAEDAQTLVIRRRLNVPAYVAWRRGSPSGRYICLRPGEDRPESLSLNLPVESRSVYGGVGPTTVKKCAKGLSLEIGFYDENLPGLVCSILQVAEKFSGTIDADFVIAKEYFRGVLVRGSMMGLLSYYEKFSEDPCSEGQVLIPYNNQFLTGEKVLRIKVDGVSIPYEGLLSAGSEDRSTGE